MAALKSSMASNLNPHFDEHKWVMHIRRTLQQELEEDDDEISISIFSVPKPLMTLHPDLYTPQQVAVGPYHCLRPDLHEMEIYKVSAARRMQKGLDTIKFHHLVDQFCCLEPRIRACYHRYLDFNGDTLAWMMAIDASFLLEFLQVFACRGEGRALTRVPSRMNHLVDTAGRKSAHNSILRDIVMLENQIPLFVLRKMMEFRFPSPGLADEELLSMLLGLYRELSPFRQSKNLPTIEISRMTHLLEFLFRMIVPELKEISQIVDVADSEMELVHSSGDTSFVKRSFNGVQKFFCLLRKVIVSKAASAVLRLPLTTISNNLPGLILLKQTVAYFFSSEEDKDAKQEDGMACSSDSHMKKPPLIEEIAIPSVTELVKSGVQFSVTGGGITSVEFDNKSSVFYLPTTELDVNSEVVLRNLVAYEASNATGPLIFTRYTELMNGIIDTKEDAKLLRERGIILNYLKSDEEVAKLWNGMSRSIRLTKVPFLDKVIEDVNKHYEGNWKVKFGRLMKLYVFGSWQLLIFLAAIMILLLLASQAFCSFYRVFRLLNVKPASRI